MDHVMSPCKSIQPVAADAPYPPVRVTKVNAQYAQMLSINLGSSQSELTSITQYIYQSWILDPTLEEMIKTMHCIAMVEMHHLDILGEMIVLLGGNPRYSSTRKQNTTVWNGNMVFPNSTVREMMKSNVELEQVAINTYIRQASVVNDPYIAKMLKRFVLDEQIHLKIFKQYLAQTNRP